jgi:hypothetical protein
MIVRRWEVVLYARLAPTVQMVTYVVADSHTSARRQARKRLTGHRTVFKGQCPYDAYWVEGMAGRPPLPGAADAAAPGIPF